MNCIEFRRLYTAAPQHAPPAALAHREQCAACAAYAQRLQAFEPTLKNAVETAPPDGLAARILLRQAMHESRQRRQRRWYAVAAGLVLVVGLTVSIWLPSTPTLSLEQTVLHHIHNELHHLHDRKAVPSTQLSALLATIGTRLTAPAADPQPLGTVHYAGLCDMRRGRGAHLVVQGERGPVTLLVMPGEAIVDRKYVSDRRFNGIIVPVPGGSLAIVGEPEETLETIERRVRAVLRFTS